MNEMLKALDKANHAPKDAAPTVDFVGRELHGISQKYFI